MNHLKNLPHHHQVKRVFEDLDGRRLATLSDISALIRAGKVKSIIIMAGAGISTAAGIPDFRSPETGIYANLEKYQLPYPEAIFDIEYFRQNPAPFYTLAKELNPKKFKPTKTHQFFKLLENKKLLKRCFTQNIDTLERLTGLSDDLIVEAHGSFATCHCLACHCEMSDEEFMSQLNKNSKPLVKCLEPSCVGKSNALIKPDIVFYGEQLPRKFFSSLEDFSEADLLIVLGTSLQVQPFASLISSVPINCPRLFINLESAGEIGSGYNNQEGFDFKGVLRGGKQFIRDVFVLGTTDEGIENLCDLLDWKDELLELYDSSAKSTSSREVVDNRVASEGSKTRAEGKKKSTDEAHWEDEKTILVEPKSNNESSKEDESKVSLEEKDKSEEVSSCSARSSGSDTSHSQQAQVDELASGVTHLSLSTNL